MTNSVATICTEPRIFVQSLVNNLSTQSESREDNITPRITATLYVVMVNMTQRCYC